MPTSGSLSQAASNFSRKRGLAKAARAPAAIKMKALQHRPAVAAHKVAQRQHEHREQGQSALAAREHAGHLRHHVAHEEQHDDDGHERDDGRVQRRAYELGAQLLPGLQVVGQAFEHLAQAAAALARADHGAVDV
ncbi:hypothetical protein ALISP_6410 [Alicycliphilus sp. B1]|nr:hypothetical protein ALISP_6410 [Alicycliphilus sp. B1]